MIRAILACDEDWGIGKNGDLPWPHKPADLKWFKKCTDGGVVVMGRKTWESLPRKPLPNRVNYVVTSDPDIEEGYYGRFSSKDVGKAIHALIEDRIEPKPDIWIIGGAQLVESCLSIIDEIWLSRIQGTYNCDTFLPRTLIETTYELISSEWEGDVYVDKWRKY
jgi:dihydrofolate reductase